MCKRIRPHLLGEERRRKRKKEEAFLFSFASQPRLPHVERRENEYRREMKLRCEDGNAAASASSRLCFDYKVLKPG